MDNQELPNNPPLFDWGCLVERAKLDGPSDLYYSLKQYAAWFHAYAGGFSVEQYPPAVIEYLKYINLPTGKRGRPKTSDWARLVFQDSYETRRQLIEITKNADGREIDEHGNSWPVTEKPSDLAVGEVANDMNRSHGAALDAIFPERKNKQRLNTKKKPE
jgi:hypothetical protein